MEDDKKIVLFQTSQSRTTLARFRSKIEAISPGSDFEIGRNSLITLVIGSMEKSPEQWDDHCQINIGWIGSSFINRLADNEKALSKILLDEICTSCFRFLFELYLSIKNDLSMEFEQARRFIFSNLSLFDESSKEQIEYTIKEMPISIFKSIANSEAIESFRDFNSASNRAEKLKADWDNDLLERASRVEKLKEEISKYETAFNFVGLFQGFDDLSKEKTKEKDNLLFWIRVLGAATVAPIFLEIAFIYLNIKDISIVQQGLLFSILPMISLVGISIYYFKILLFNYKSVKSHILQIELRKTLCRFIQHYADYSSKIKEKDRDSLSKFENIIFSGIVSDDEKLPTAYDGIEQIGQLIKSVRQ